VRCAALLATAHGERPPALVALVALPFVLAALTGVAKTMTARGLFMSGTIGSLVEEASDRRRDSCNGAVPGVR
jgi:hypothetical protein